MVNVELMPVLMQELCVSPEAKAHILEELTAVGRAGKLKGFELIKAIHTGEQALELPSAALAAGVLTAYQSAMCCADSLD